MCGERKTQKKILSSLMGLEPTTICALVRCSNDDSDDDDDALTTELLGTQVVSNGQCGLGLFNKFFFYNQT